MDQINLFDLLGFYSNGDIVDSCDLRSVCSFDWLVDHIGYMVALRRRTESNLYFIAGTVLMLTVGTWFDGCRRIVLDTGNGFALLDEPLFFLGYGWYNHFVFEL